MEKVVEVSKMLSDWNNVEELKTFLAQDNTDSSIFVKFYFGREIKLGGFCEDFAVQLQNRAYEIGKRLDTEILAYDEYNKYYGVGKINPGVGTLGINDGHAINKAIVGNEVWFIEPQTDKIWLAYYLN